MGKVESYIMRKRGRKIKMKLLLNQMTVFRNGAADQVSVLVDNGRIISISK